MRKKGYRPMEGRAIHRYQCYICLDWFMSEKPGLSKYRCNSSACKGEHLRRLHAPAKARRKMVKDEVRTYRRWSRRAAKRMQAADRAKVPQVRVCGECGSDFSTAISTQRYCSSDCAYRNERRRYRTKRKAAERAAHVESVDPIAVLERDGWRCRICGIKTPQRLRGTYDDRAPELDHIIPLSCGGEHSYRNTQCLCRRCNQEKLDTPMGQLLLVG